ncbi:hypothetical protein PYW07_010467 [Mythimna separata]|uniref:Kazal-like domain-containing protein n=1 Tax=Mythimna separata TaxID=271217 RepID=A0AAD8DLH7_MYTSE|nr:hypothetical protein PYW07_010467 [Mythimna separata]
MLVIFLTVISVIYHYAAPKTIEFYPPFQDKLKCSECLRIYFPVCATDNETYTNECRFRCIQSRRKPRRRANITRVGPCILGSRRKRYAMNSLFFTDNFS